MLWICPVHGERIGIQTEEMNQPVCHVMVGGICPKCQSVTDPSEITIEQWGWDDTRVFIHETCLCFVSPIYCDQVLCERRVELVEAAG